MNHANLINRLNFARPSATVKPNAAPFTLTATPYSSSRIDLAWEDIATNEDGYSIERSLNGSTGWTEIATVGANTTSYQNSTGLTEGSRYYYRVRTFKGVVKQYSDYSNTANTYTKPTAPSGLTLSVISDSEIDLSWTDNTTHADDIRIERSLTGSGGWSEIATVNLGVGTYQDADRDEETEYFYRARSKKSTIYSGYCTIESETTEASGPNGAPSNLVLVVDSDTQMTISWTNGATNQDGTRVYISTDNVTFTEKGTASGSATSFPATELTAGTSYYFYVVHYKGTHESSTSNTVSGSYWDSLSTSTIEDATPGNVVLTFDKASTQLLASDFIVRTKEYFIQDLPDYAILGINKYQGQYYNGKTYIAYAGWDDDPYIITYTHATKIFSAPVKIGTNPLPNGDGHGEPAIFIDATGYIHIIWGAHLTAFNYVKSTNPEDVTAWTAKTSPAIGTYPQFLQFSDGTIYLFYRDASTPRKWGYKTSTNGGTSWSAFTEITHDLSYGVFEKGVGDTIHGVMLGYPQVTDYNRCNLYYLIYSGGGWQNIDGDALTLVLDHTSDFLVYDSGANYVPMIAYNFNSSNKPYILFTEGTDVTGTYNYKFARNDGVNWVITSLGVGTSHWRDIATCLDVVSTTDIETYLITGGTAAAIGGNVEKWGSTDTGATWAKLATIKADSNQYIDPILIKDYNAEAKLFFAQFRNLPATWAGRGYLYGSGGFVCNNKSISSLSRDVTNKILTLTLSSRIYLSETLEVLMKSVNSNITNNVKGNLVKGLLNYCKMNETTGNMIDIISGNNGVVTGVTRNVNGKIGKCYSFDGNDNVIFSQYHTFETAQSFAIVFWMKAAAVNTTEFMVNETDVPATVSSIVIKKINADLYFIIRDVSGTAQVYVAWLGILTTDWTLVGAVRDAEADQLNLWVNAVPYATPVTDTQVAPIGPINIKLGRYNDTQDYTGLMDEFAIYTRALSQDEWTELYNAGNGKTHPF